MQASTLASTLWSAGAGDPAELDQLRFTHTDTQLPSTFAVGVVASATIGVQALAAASLWRPRGGTAQSVQVNQRHALAMFRSERYVQVNGTALPDPWSPIAGYYQAGD